MARPLGGGPFRFVMMPSEELDRVERAYDRLSRRWAWSVLSFAGFQGWESAIRRRTVERLELKPGDAVLDVGCGRGSNFSLLERAVGPQGRIVGVDYSSDMLRGAQELVGRRRWSNVEVVRADAAEMSYAGEFDAALCTVSMSVIPRWREALSRMVAAVKPGGRVVVMDGRLGTGIRRLGNSYARLFARITAADLSRDIPGEFRRLVDDPREEKMFFGTYYVLSGRAPATEDESEGEGNVQAGR